MTRLMIRLRFACAALIGCAAAFALPVIPAIAQPSAHAAAIDALFDQLRKAPDAATAQVLAGRIWQTWTSPEDVVLRTRMIDVLEMRRRATPADVIALLDDIIADYPAYSEAWNQRATMHYLEGDNAKSLADIAKTLELEPRHFGALAGRAMIYKSQGKDDLALADIIAALAIHPFLAERAMFPELKTLINA